MKTPLELLVLIAVLQLHENAYGVTIQKEIENRTGKAVAPSAVYITLDRLVKKGYIATELGEPTPQRGGRAKRYFRILGLGEKALKESFASVAKMAGDLKPALEGG